MLLWAALLAFGILSYTTFMRREGFPSVSIPVAVVNGVYFVNDSARIDAEVSKPVSDLALKDKTVTTVQTENTDNFFAVSIQYKEGTDAVVASEKLKKQLEAAKALPPDAKVNFNVPYFGVTGGDIEQIDLAISFFNKDNNVGTQELAAKAQEVAKWLDKRKIPGVNKVFVKNPIEQVIDPATGQTRSVQRNFDRFGIRESNSTKYYSSTIIGIASNKGVDVIKLDNDVRNALTDLKKQNEFKGYDAKISASNAPAINESISELQRVLLEGLIAVLIVGSIVITFRASVVTVIAMVTVLASTVALLFLLGYSLNVITLFALILGLSLIVDDTIIMVEAIDAARRRTKTPKEAVRMAVNKISLAMVAATTTAALSFAPLLFVGGVLGDFIKAIPVTIISSLIISLIVALVFIPLFARALLLRQKQMGERGVREVAANFEAKIARGVARPMLWARGSKKRLFMTGATAVLLGFLFFGSGIFIASKVVFNIFPPTKDTNGIFLSLFFPAGTDIEDAQRIAADADKIAVATLGDNFVQSSYYNTGSAQAGMEQIQITSYAKRDVTSPQLVTQLQEKYDKEFSPAKVAVSQIDFGPPISAFIVQINATDREAAFKTAEAVSTFLNKAELVRPSGEKARFKNINISSPNQYIRDKGASIVRVTADFNGTDTTTLVTLGQNAVKKEFNANKLSQYGLGANAVSFDIGQESENQDSFKTLAIAFPVLLIIMYLLLALQFRSLLQPLLIFMAIPFSVFGVMLGLYLTDNPISFFSMLGFFALIGLSIKNTILLTDYANQGRRSGLGAIDSAVEAVEERFRPLVATSLTAVVALVPLALSSPFWQGLAVVLIFGLLSSTTLVILIFPYYYLGAEYLRMKVSRKGFLLWAIFNVGLIFLLINSNVKYVLPILLLINITWFAFRKYSKKRRA